MRNLTKLKENWRKINCKAKETIEILSEDDLFFEEGQKEEMLKKLQFKFGSTREELYKMITKLKINT